MKRIVIILNLLFLLLVLGCQTTQVKGHNPVGTNKLSESGYSASIAPDMALMMNSPVEGKSAAWLAYLLARVRWINNNISEPVFSDDGLYQAQFEEELAGLGTLAGIWREFKKNKKAGKDRYLEDLLLIEESGYLREYVWSTLKLPFWNEPNGLKLDEFKA